ncbi:GDP-mannose 4,6-dehydratase [bacterium]|nr:GDP-mannose 4,6-dehydratase [bacterium]
MSRKFWQDRPTLITGATGLLGGWLTRQLINAGADVICLVRDWVPDSQFNRSNLSEKATVVRGQIEDQALLERVLGEYEIDTVFHLAAQTIVQVANRNPVSTFESNIGGAYKLLEACRRSPEVSRVILASSDKAYGDQLQLPYDEQMPLQGMHPYDVSKSCADLIAQMYYKSYKLPVTITRCGNFFGGGDLNWNRIVPGTIRSVIRGQRPVIRSDGQFIRDYIYIEDGAAAYIKLAEKMDDCSIHGQAFNFSYENQITVIDLVKTILRLMDSDLVPDIKNEASNEILHQFLSASKARRLLKWEPLFTLEDGLFRTINWYGQYFGEVK